MLELLREATAIYNLPLTVMLGMILVYWALVILGRWTWTS